MNRWLFALMLILLVAATVAAVVVYLDSTEQRRAVEQFEAQRQEHEESDAALHKTAADLQKERSELIEDLKRNLAAQKIEGFPDLSGFTSASWVYPMAIPRFTGGKVSGSASASPILATFEHDSPNVYASSDDFFTVVDWYRLRVEAFLERTGNKVPKPPAWPAKPFTAGTVGSYSSARSKPEPRGVYVYLVMRSDKADELRTATVGVRGGVSGITAFITQSGDGKSKTMITLVRDRIDLRFQTHEPKTRSGK